MKRPRKEKQLIYLIFFVLLSIFGLIALYISLARTPEVEAILITNQTGTGATITYTTKSKEKGIVYYKEKDELTWSIAPILSTRNVEKAYDDRDIDQDENGDWELKDDGLQDRYTHHVTLRNLEPETEYEFRIGTRYHARAYDTTNFKTGKINPDLSTPDPAYGQVEGVDNYTKDSIVYINLLIQEEDEPGHFQPLDDILSVTVSDNASYSFDLNYYKKLLAEIDSNEAILKLNFQVADQGNFTTSTDIDTYKPINPFKIALADYYDVEVASTGLGDSGDLPDGGDKNEEPLDDGGGNAIPGTGDNTQLDPNNCSSYGLVPNGFGGCKAPENLEGQAPTSETAENSPNSTTTGINPQTNCNSSNELGFPIKNTNGGYDILCINKDRCVAQDPGVGGIASPACGTSYYAVQDSTYCRCEPKSDALKEVYGDAKQITQAQVDTIQQESKADTNNTAENKNITTLTPNAKIQDNIVKNKPLDLPYDNECQAYISTSSGLIGNLALQDYGIKIIYAKPYYYGPQVERGVIVRALLVKDGKSHIENITETVESEDVFCSPISDDKITQIDELIISQTGETCYKDGVQYTIGCEYCGTDGFIRAIDSQTCSGIQIYTQDATGYREFTACVHNNDSGIDQCTPQNFLRTQRTQLENNLLNTASAASDKLVVENSGNYITYYGDDFEQPISEFAVNLDGSQKAEIRLFIDANGNGKKDESEEVLDDYSQISLKKDSEVATYNLNVGWNLVALPVISSEGISTASELMDHFNDQGADIKHIARYTDAGFEMYTKREGDNEFSDDFNIVPGQGYFVLNYEAKEVKIKGNKFDEAVPFRVRNGWNLVGVYTNEKPYTAEELLKDMVAQGITADVASMYNSGLYTSVVYEDDLVYGNNYNLFERQGYFIRVKEGGGADIKFTPQPQ